MATKNPKPIVHTFTILNSGEFKSVKHYSLKSIDGGKNQISNRINVQKDRKFAKSMPDYWLKKRLEKKWSAPITGLFQTKHKNIYHGDCNFKKHLLLVHITDDQDKITIFFYKGFFTLDRDNLIDEVDRYIKLRNRRDV